MRPKKMRDVTRGNDCMRKANILCNLLISFQSALEFAKSLLTVFTFELVLTKFITDMLQKFDRQVIMGESIICHITKPVFSHHLLKEFYVYID